MFRKLIFYCILNLALFLFIQACTTRAFRSNYKDMNSLIHDTQNNYRIPFIKAHYINGDVSILNAGWKLDSTGKSITGIGKRYDYNRNIIASGPLLVNVDSISLFETNEKLGSEAVRIVATSILTAVDVVIGIYCITNPKACFGSCPTFYINENNNLHYADAEGFSNAILPSMEYTDIDALNYTATADTFSVTMKNEALETHCINEVSLLLCKKNAGEKVYHAYNDKFFLCSDNLHQTSHARGNEGDITELLKYDDSKERFSLSDAENLSSREEVFLDFDGINTDHQPGLILNFRQTLMTTYLFYSAMGYMGDEASDMFNLLQTDNSIRGKFDATTKELGKIDIYMWDEVEKQWVFENRFYETGPIAVNRQFMPLKAKHIGSRVKVKIVLNKGLWRLDYAAIAEIKNEIKPQELKPCMIYNKGKVDSKALTEISDSRQYLISMPGSEYRICFDIPGNNSKYDLFLSSRGYYLEWMREHWLKDKDLNKLKEMVFAPRRYLKQEAAQYKKYETSMEQEFWSSRIDTKSFSYHEK